MKFQEDFTKGKWMQEVDVRDFIQLNYTPYHGDEAFLKGPTAATKELWRLVSDLMEQERRNRVPLTLIQKSYLRLSPMAQDI